MNWKKSELDELNEMNGILWLEWTVLLESLNWSDVYGMMVLRFRPTIRIVP